MGEVLFGAAVALLVKAAERKKKREYSFVMVRAHLYFVNLKTLQSNKWFFIKELSLFLASWKSVFVGFSHTLRWSILKLYSIFFTGVKFLIHARQSSELFLYIILYEMKVSVGFF